MELPLFKLEEYLTQWEFKAPYLLCCSDAESISMSDLVAMADAESKKLWETLHLGYTEVPGLPVLRETITSQYSSISAEDVLTFAGAEDGIFCTMHGLLSPKDHVIAIVPAYQSLVDLPKSMGADTTAIALKPELQWKLDLDEVAKAFRPNTKLLVINFPHNPTGANLDAASLDKLIELCRKAGAYLFSDEVYRFMEIDENDRLPSVADIYERGISLSVMSKAYGLAGLRLGWICTKDQVLLKKIQRVKHYTSICNSAPSEILSLMALRAKDKILARNRDIIRSNLELLDPFFERFAHVFRWVRPKGGCIGFPELLLKEDIDSFCKSLVEKKGVLLMPASIYNTPGNFFRIGFGRKNMPLCLEKLTEFLKS